MSSVEALMHCAGCAPATSKSTATTGGLVSGMAAELRAAYPDAVIRTSGNGLSIPQTGYNGFPVGLIVLENGVFYLNLGWAEFEVHDRQTALDLLILGFSRVCRLRTTHIGGRLRDWFLDMHTTHDWHCIHSGGLARFAPWRTVEEEQRANFRPLTTLGEATRCRILVHFQVPGSEI